MKILQTTITLLLEVLPMIASIFVQDPHTLIAITETCKYLKIANTATFGLVNWLLDRSAKSEPKP